MDLSDIREEIIKTIKDLNKAWVEKGNIDELGYYFHKDALAITPFDKFVLDGREECMTSWRRFVESSKIISWNTYGFKVNLYGNESFAVVTYYYDISYERGGEICNTSGRDMMVLAIDGGKWLVVADQFSPSL